MLRLITALVLGGCLACAVAPPAPTLRLDEALGSGAAPVEAPKVEATTALAAALGEFEAVARRERAVQPRGAPMPAAQVAAWERLLDAVEGLLSQPARQTSPFDLARSRLVLESCLDADMGAFGDVPSELADRVPVMLRRLSVRLGALGGAARHTTEGPLRLVWPTSPAVVTSAWGDRLHPLHGDVRFHAGVDLAGEPAQEVRAAAAGTVVFSGWNGAHGKQVEVQHGVHLSSRYSHLQALLVAVGRPVKQGDIIGLLGDTGQVTGPHLHFELRSDGESIDPLERLPPALDRLSRRARR